MNILINLGTRVNYFIVTNLPYVYHILSDYFLCHIQYDKIIVVL